MPPDKDVILVTSAGHDGLRLDTFVAGQWDCSRHAAALLIKNGTILVDGRPRKPSCRVGVNQTITACISLQKAEKPCPEPAPISILFEDAFLLIVNKPPGLVVHPAPGHKGGTLVNRLLHHFPAIGSAGDSDRPGIVHRLDKNTSGAMVVAKTAAAHQALSHMFKSRQVRKTYLALVYGQMKSSDGIVTLPIGRHTLERKKMSVSSPQARPAETRWKVRKAFTDASLLELEIHTGRTHQIRVHCTALQRPVVGDPTYPCKWTRKRQHFSSRAAFELLSAAGRQMLHAWRLEFDHPVTGAPMCFTAPLSEDIKEMLHLLRAIDAENGSKGA